MKTKTINLAIPEDLLYEVDRVAKEEFRSRSELLREALRGYILPGRYKRAIQNIRAEAKRQKYQPSDVETWISTHRAKK